MSRVATIGIDVRKIRDFGIGRHLEGLIGALADGPGRDRYVLFASEDPERSVPARLMTTLPADRFEVVPVDAPLYSVREILAFRGAARRFSLDLLHFPHYVRGLAPGCPVAVTIHDAIHLTHPPSRRARWYARAMMTWAARSAACLFTVSAAARDELSTHLGVPRGQFRVTPNGVDERFHPPSPEAVSDFRARRQLDLPFVLCIASHRPHKNLRAAVDGFESAGLEDVEFVVPARDAETAERLRPLVRSERCRVLTGVRDEDLPLLYAAADVVLCPSRSEGFGLPALEAAACGGVVLATAIPAHREVMSDAAAYLAASATAHDIASALSSLWADGNRRAGLRGRGPERASHFPWRETARLTEEGYAAAIRPASRPVR